MKDITQTNIQGGSQQDSQQRPKGNPQTHVIVGMSGGVDSSVAALLLKQQGYHVEGLFMKNWDEDDGTEYCTAKLDLVDAQSVCERLKIHLHTANFAAEYWDNVFKHFIDEYQSGRTPNPDILCNKEIKFKAFLEYAQHLGADFIATGHYARKVSEENDSGGPNKIRLLKGKDSNKDQSYFLYAVSGHQIDKTLFPLGEFEKPEVRRIAQEHNLITHDKKDSTGICFIGERRFKDFLEQYLPAKPGKIRTEKYQYLGEHDGLMYHTLGQRQGLKIGGIKGAPENPWYVADKDLNSNELIVVQGNNHPRLFSKQLTAKQVNWISEVPPPMPLHCHAKVRYRQKDQVCTVKKLPDGCLQVFFNAPQRAVTPGQSVVFYDDQICLGGAIIESRM